MALLCRAPLRWALHPPRGAVFLRGCMQAHCLGLPCMACVCMCHDRTDLPMGILGLIYIAENSVGLEYPGLDLVVLCRYISCFS